MSGWHLENAKVLISGCELDRFIFVLINKENTAHTDLALVQSD